MNANAQERQVWLRSQVSATQADVDIDLIRRVVTNLVDNAIRHAPADTTVTISTRRVDGGVELRVADRGPGVPEHLRKQVFEPFIQLDAHGDLASTRAGRGLGLTFCRLAAEAHGGAIWIEDGNPGAVFCVSIPDAPAP
jgi:signal transduction histidine kinase